MIRRPDHPLDALTALLTPALLIRLDRVRANLERMRALLDDDLDRWRPHVKTIKVGSVLTLLLDAGVRRFKCATTREAAVLLASATESVDLLIAYAHRGANLARIAALARQHPHHRVAVLTDEPEHARTVRDLGLGLFLDLDPGWGRSGAPLDDRARLDATARSAGPALVGLQLYEGHVLDPEPAHRADNCRPLYRRLLALADELNGVSSGRRQPLELLTSGTPTFAAALAEPALRGRSHRVGPGTVVYGDLASAELGVEGFAPAATVLTRVISAPGPDTVTCDAGSKAIDAAVRDPVAAVVDWPGLIARRPSEEHLPLTVAAEDAPPAGTLLELIPRHVCPTVNLHDVAVLLDGEAPPRVVPVDARGHEVEAPTASPSA